MSIRKIDGVTVDADTLDGEQPAAFEDAGVAATLIAAAIADLATLVVAETQVYSAAAPTAWTDLDLSAVVGTNKALVLLKVVTAASGAHSVAFRKDGDTDEFYFELPGEGTHGVSCVTPNINVHAGVLVATSDAGVIEWKCEDTSTFVIDVIAYVK